MFKMQHLNKTHKAGLEKSVVLYTHYVQTPLKSATNKQFVNNKTP